MIPFAHRIVPQSSNIAWPPELQLRGSVANTLPINTPGAPPAGGVTKNVFESPVFHSRVIRAA